MNFLALPTCDAPFFDEQPGTLQIAALQGPAEMVEELVNNSGVRRCIIFLTQREELLKYLPKGWVGAEIGVAQGEYSAAILQSAQPAELHLDRSLEPSGGWMPTCSAPSKCSVKLDMPVHAAIRSAPFRRIVRGHVQYSEDRPARFEGMRACSCIAYIHTTSRRPALRRQAISISSTVDGNHHYKFVTSTVSPPFFVRDQAAATDRTCSAGHD